MAEGDVEAEERGEHAVDEAVAEGGQQHDERKFDGDKKGLLRAAPPAHGGAIAAGAANDNGEMKGGAAGAEMAAPGGNRVGLAAEKDGELALPGGSGPEPVWRR